MSYLNGNYKAENSADPELSVLLTRKQPKVIPSAPKCSKCNKSVYAAEETRAANQIFHKLCFKCTSCNKLLQPNLITEHAGDLYCKSCYAKQFGPKGYGYGCGAGTLSMENGHSLTSSNNLVKSNSTENENTPSSNSWVLIIPIKKDLIKFFFLRETNITSSMSCSSISSIYSNSSLTNRLERKTTLPLASLNSNNSCARCNKVVYAAEKVSAAGHVIN